METSWKEHLTDEFGKEYFQKLTAFIKKEYASKTIYPPPKFVFRAFDMCPFDEVKVVILGQDPYHGKDQANGLCFSVNEGIALPPSLQNIFKEIESDLGTETSRTAPVSTEKSAPRIYPSGYLDRWAKQGVLLLNATLTVQAATPGSHQHQGWEEFTDRIIQLISEKRSNVVFILWGRYAQEKGAHIDTTKHLVLKAAHPSPFSAYSGFFGCKHFSKTNVYLTEHGKKAIEW